MLKHRGLSVSMLLFGFRRTAVSALLIVLAAGLGFSQTAGTLSGTIKDPSGLAISSAVVTLAGDQASAEKKTAATDSGTYTFGELRSRRLYDPCGRAGFQRSCKRKSN